MSSFIVVKWVRDNGELIRWIFLIIGLWLVCGFVSVLLFRFGSPDDDER